MMRAFPVLVFLVACGGSGEPECDVPNVFFRDSDADGYGLATDSRTVCEAPEGFVDNNLDCDDTNAEVHPAAVEVCDGVDNNCNTFADDADPTVEDRPARYRDADGDGHGDPATSIPACEVPSGYVEDGDDCDDTDALFHPGAEESDCADPNDYNCDGSTGFTDADGDGFAACEDCNDASAAAHEGATEVCDEIDNDCDGLTDDEDDSLRSAPGWYADTDGDGYGVNTDVAFACIPPTGYVGSPGDCDDEDDRLHPETVWYIDDDGDGYGVSDSTVVQCEAVDGYAIEPDDCDDDDRLSNPGRTFDFGDEADNDCDGDVDEDVGSETYSHEDDIQGVWSSKCGACHTTSSSGGLNLSDAYDNIVDVASDSVTSMARIEPGDPENSYLWHKINGTQATVGGGGNAMPPPTSGKTLSAAQLSMIETWILEGAVE